MSILYLDTETTGLDPRIHVPWEVAIIEEDGTEHHWLWRPSFGWMVEADDTALDIGGFHDRAPRVNFPETQYEAALAIVELTEGNIIAGSNPSFDTGMLTPWLRSWNLEPAWHHRPVCIATMAYGWLHAYDQAAGEHIDLPLPWRSDDLSRACGINPDDYDRHTALGDAQWVRDWHQRLTGQHA
jgi:hypothetical protein